MVESFDGAGDGAVEVVVRSRMVSWEGRAPCAYDHRDFSWECTGFEQLLSDPKIDDAPVRGGEAVQNLHSLEELVIGGEAAMGTVTRAQRWMELTEAPCFGV